MLSERDGAKFLSGFSGEGIGDFVAERRRGNSGLFDVDALALCDSTSSELMRRAERGAPAGSVIVADEQSAGRGRRGRQWLSAPAASLTFSLLWRFSGPATMLSGLSLAVGVGLTRGLESLGAQSVCLKWPNDVLVLRGHDYAKLAGILVDLSSDRSVEFLQLAFVGDDFAAASVSGTEGDGGDGQDGEYFLHSLVVFDGVWQRMPLLFNKRLFINNRCTQDLFFIPCELPSS